MFGRPAGKFYFPHIENGCLFVLGSYPGAAIADPAGVLQRNPYKIFPHATIYTFLVPDRPAADPKTFAGPGSGDNLYIQSGGMDDDPAA